MKRAAECNIPLFDPADFQNEVVSQIRDNNGSLRVVSRFGDDSWDLSGFIPNPNRSVCNTRINFAITLPDGLKLTDEINRCLLNSVKRYLLTRLQQRSSYSGRCLKATSVIKEFEALVIFVRWLTTKNINCFSSMTTELCLDYAQWCRNELVPTKHGVLKPRFTSGRLVILLSVVHQLHANRAYLQDAILQPPWGDLSISELSGHCQKNSVSVKTEKIPDRLAMQCAMAAIAYIEEKAERLLFARDWINTLDSTNKAESFIDHAVGKKTKHQINKFLAAQSLPQPKELSEQLHLLRSACYVVIALFSGMRASEIASLAVGAYQSTTDTDGETYHWLRGFTYKFEAVPRLTSWMVPPIVGKAISVLEKWSAPLHSTLAVQVCEMRLQLASQNDDASDIALIQRLAKAENAQSALWLGVAKNAALPMPQRLSSSHTLRLITQFAEHIDLIVTSDDLPEIQDRGHIKVGDIWPLAPHQFRRTFAVFVARHRMGDLRYLRHHFKHWSIDMTLLYTRDHSLDDGLLTDIDLERENLQTLLIEDWLTSDKPLSGGAGQRMMVMRGCGQPKTFRNPYEFARQIGDGLFIRGTGHSWCLANGTGCGGQGLYDRVRCVGCGDAIIDATHKAIWHGIRAQQLEVLAWPDIGFPVYQRCVTHLRMAESVLADLGELVPPPLNDITNDKLSHAKTEK
jgi:integrase